MSDRDDRDHDERPGQRDWRELDRRKDRSAHGREGPKPRGGKRFKAMQQAAQKEYLTGLRKLFDTGEAGGRVGKILPSTPKAGGASASGGSARQEGIKRIRAAVMSTEVEAAVDAFRAEWELPEDCDALMQVLLHPDEAVVAEALAILDRIMPLKRATRRETFRARLRRVEEDEDSSAETRELAARVRGKA